MNNKTWCVSCDSAYKTNESNSNFPPYCCSEECEQGYKEENNNDYLEY
ncbi:hypothetical protein [Rossellomorea marisflavi]|nr:hypothetical protein [Rossellomorea marisflavi]